MHSQEGNQYLQPHVTWPRKCQD